jgi:hypothetical protein
LFNHLGDLFHPPISHNNQHEEEEEEEEEDDDDNSVSACAVMWFISK